MTKNNYIEFAKELSLIKQDAVNSTPSGAWELAVMAVANVCLRDNPRFDEDKFLKACKAEGDE